MTFVISEPCIDVMDKSCVDECPVDCIYQGEYKLYINPIECIDCGACETVCPVDAITADRRTPDDRMAHLADNAAFFSETLSGRSAPIGNPGGARKIDAVGADTPLINDTRQGLAS